MPTDSYCSNDWVTRSHETRRGSTMTKDELLDRLMRLAPVEFEVTLAKLDVPPAHIPVVAPQVIRAVDVVRYLDANGRLAVLEAALSALEHGGQSAVVAH